MKHGYRVEVYGSDWRTIVEQVERPVRQEVLDEAWELAHERNTLVRVVRFRNGSDVEVVGSYSPEGEVRS